MTVNFWNTLKKKIFRNTEPESRRRGRDLLASPALAGWIETLPLEECAPGATLFEPGEPCTRLPLLTSGRAMVYGHDETGRRVDLYRLHPGEICPMSLAALLQQQNYVAGAHAETRVRLRYLPGDTFRSRIAQDPASFAIFLETFSDCLQDVTSAVRKQ